MVGKTKPVHPIRVVRRPGLPGHHDGWIRESAGPTGTCEEARTTSGPGDVTGPDGGETHPAEAGNEAPSGAVGPDEAARLEAENERLKEELERVRSGEEAAARARRRGKTRSILTAVLAILTAISIFAATVGVWTQRTLASPDRYVALVAPLAKDPAVTNALATRLTDEVFTALNVQSEVQQALAAIPNLPPAASFIAGPIAAAAHNLIETQVANFLQTDTFANLWTQLNLQVHTKVKALLNGDYSQLPNVSIDGGEVQLNLVSLVAQILQQLAQSGLNSLGINVTVPSIPPDLASSAAIQQLSSALGVSLPPDFGQVTIMTADQLTSYQKTVRQLKRGEGALVLLSILLLAATIIVAPRRRRAVIWLGAATVVALFLGGVFLRRMEASIVDSITGPAAKAAATDVFAQVTTSLRHTGLLVITVAIVVALIAYLTGRPRWLVRAAAWIQRVTAPSPEGSELEVWVARYHDPVRVIGIAVAVVILFITGIDWLPVAIVGALLAVFLWGVAVAEQRSRVAPAQTTEMEG